MKKTIVFSFLLCLLLQIEAQAQPYSIMTGIVTEVQSRWLTMKNDDGEIVQLRIGYKTVYPNSLPFVGDRVKVEYLIIREVPIGFSVAILERRKKEVEDRPKLPSDLPPELASLVGKWEGFWDNRIDMHFSLTIPNVNLEVAEVKYESNDLKFSEMAKVILGEKTRIEWTIQRIYDIGGLPPHVFYGSRQYLVWYNFELQKDGTLEGSFYYRFASPGRSRGRAVMRKTD